MRASSDVPPNSLMICSFVMKQIKAYFTNVVKHTLIAAMIVTPKSTGEKKPAWGGLLGVISGC